MRIEAALDLTQKRKGLPLSIQMHEMARLGAEELLTLCALSGPLVVWRGRLCYRYEDRPAKTTLEPTWVFYHADEFGMGQDLAEAANGLTRTKELIALPEVHFPRTLQDFGRRLKELPEEASENFRILDMLYSRITSVEQLPVSLLSDNRPSMSGDFTAKLPLPVMFRCPTRRYTEFVQEYDDDLTRLRHALRDLYRTSQELTRESTIGEIASELDYQIAKLNTLYMSALRSRRTSGAGIIVGCIITMISFVIPAELRPYLFALGTPSTVFAGLKWLGQAPPDTQCRSSDYYMAWKFRTK